MNECDHVESLIIDDGIPEWIDEDKHLTDYDHDYVVYVGEEQSKEENETLSQIEDYMNSNCKECSFGKGSQQCENCYVGGY